MKKWISLILLLLCTAPQTRGCLHGDVRLVNVATEYQGTVEVCVAGRWSGVCADRQSHQEATVVCRQLGCEDSVRSEIEQERCPNNTIKSRCGGKERELLDCSLSDGTDCSSINSCLNIRCSLCQARSDLLPYGELVEDLRVPTVDDGSTDELVLRQPFPFFGETYGGVYINTNGIIFFNRTSPRVILPFLTDVDIRCRGKIYYRETADDETLNQAKLLLRDHRPASEFSPTSLFITTWYSVPRFPCSFSSLNNTFQTVLMTDGTISYVCFLYEDIQWGSGALIGFDSGNRSFVEPFSLTNVTLNIDSLSNINGRRGVFIYRVNGNQIISPDSQVESPAQLRTREITATSVELAWTSSRHSAVQEYNVYFYHPSCLYCGANLPRPGVLRTANTSATLGGLVPYTEYACCATLITSNDESDCSEEIAFRTSPVPPTAPKSVTLTNATSTSVQLEWSSPQYSNGTVTHYTVRCSQRDRVVWFNTSVDTRETVRMLRPLTNYTCCVSASNQAGEGDGACVRTMTLSEDRRSSLNLAAVSAGAVLALLVLLVAIATVITCLCVSKRKRQQGKRTVEPVYDSPEFPVDGMELNFKNTSSIEPALTRNMPQFTENGRENGIHYSCGFKVGPRHERSVTTSKVEMATENGARQRAMPRKPQVQEHYVQTECKQHQQEAGEKTYQPLIPPKTHMTPPVSTGYQDLTHCTKNNSKSMDTAGNSEGHYEVVGEINQYQPLTFGVNPHTDVYQMLSKRDESSHYQNLDDVPS